MNKIIKKVQNFSFQYDLFREKDKIIIAVSGGPDSVCLLDIFFQLQKKYKLELIVAHINYSLRGEDSQKDEALVVQLAKKYRLKIEILRPLIKKTSHSENYLREIRYDFFEKIRKENKFNKVAVAHNLDDQAETFLMRTIRGAGLLGLSAMQFKNKYLIRPLLGIERKEIVEYLKEHHLKWRIDKTNLESVFLRNKIRNKLIPLLEENFNPQIKKTIFQATRSIAGDYSFINKKAEEVFQKNHSFEIEKLRKLPGALLKRIILKLIEKEKGSLQNVEYAQIEEIIKIIKSTKNKSQVMLLLGLRIRRKNGKLTIEKIRAKKVDKNKEN